MLSLSKPMQPHRPNAIIPEDFFPRVFCSPNITFGQIAQNAVAIAQATNNASALCLGTEDKALVASALLSSFGGGAPLVIPHTLSDDVIREASQRLNTQLVLSDEGRKLPTSLRALQFRGEDSTAPPLLEQDPHRIALWLFTGGSTGVPKIWGKTSHNLLSEARYLNKSFGIGGDDIFLASVPPYHIYGLLFSVLMPLLSGATTTTDVPYFPAEITGAIGRESATLLVSVPAHYRALARMEISAPSLRMSFSSGGKLDPSDAARFLGQTGTPVTEIFGSTETGGIASRSGNDSWRVFDPISWRNENGLLALKSPFLSPDVVTTSDGYHCSADRILTTTEGTFTLLGRDDEIVKVGGKRVDVAQISLAITAIPGIADVHVHVSRRNDGRENHIDALYAGDVSEALLKASLQERLPPHFMPRSLVCVEAIPTLATGKRDRKAIKELLTTGGKMRADIAD